MIRHVGCQVRVASRYNELEKVSGVETFQNELGGFKVGREVVSFRSPRKCLALEILSKEIGNKLSV